MIPDRPPRPGLGLLKRAAIACVLITVMSAGATAAAGFLQISDVVEVIRQEGRAPLQIPELTRAEAGQPQTIMVLGSDRRYEDIELGRPARSDTIILVRLDPDKEATAIMSIPRDLKVDIELKNGHVIRDRINRAYSEGGARLTVKTVKRLLDINVNHVINVNFGGFRRAIDYIGCVYLDIDRRYFNDNSGPEPKYATIDIKPGYQKLCGRDSLDYVRYRHEDNDLVRAARQQDFLRQVKAQAGVKQLLVGKRRDLARIFARYTDTDRDLRSSKQIIRLLKLAIFSARHPIREVKFRITSEDASYVEASPAAIRRTVREFMHARASKGPRGRLEPTEAERRAARGRKKKKSAMVPGLEVAAREAEDKAIVATPRLRGRLPLYYPRLRTKNAVYAGDIRVYRLRDELGKWRRAYRIVVKKGIVGEYYGVQGMTWKDPPILDDPSEVRRIGGRTFELFYDGNRLRLVAWRTERGVYWVSNTLLQTINSRQMLAIARSLTRVGR